LIVDIIVCACLVERVLKVVYCAFDLVAFVVDIDFIHLFNLSFVNLGKSHFAISTQDSLYYNLISEYLRCAYMKLVELSKHV